LRRNFRASEEIGGAQESAFPARELGEHAVQRYQQLQVIKVPRCLAWLAAREIHFWPVRHARASSRRRRVRSAF
jgi:hypothetical protein